MNARVPHAPSCALFLAPIPSRTCTCGAIPSSSTSWRDYSIWLLTKLSIPAEQEGKALVALGLAGEAGEAADVVKKELWHKIPNDMKLLEECGDVLFYLTALLHVYGFTLGDAINNNITKLNKRYPDGFAPGGGVR